MNNYSFQPPASAAEWEAYHDIRRKVLFEARGRFGVYQKDHPDEHASGHHPFLLLLSGTPIATVRVDLPPGDRRAFFRRVAVAVEYQRQGHGRKLMEEAEAFAERWNRPIFMANVALTAIPFYQKLGYVPDLDPDQTDPNNPRMVKTK